MKCPKCRHEMEQVVFEGVEVDRCRNCKGIWFDVGERDWLLGDDAAKALDTGDPAVGRHANLINRYRCPRCDGGMLRRSISRPDQLDYEECTSCRGSFFDAGEFTELIRGAKADLDR